MKRFWGMLTVMVLAAGLAGVCPAQWIVDGATWPDGGVGGFSPDEEDDPCAGCVSTNHAGDVSIDGELSLTGGLTLGGERRETWPEVAFAESNRLWVDWRNDSGTEDGSVYQPFSTVQAALDAIGGAGDEAAYTNASTRYYVVDIASGRYAGPVTVPFRPHIMLALDGAVIEGDLTWAIPDWGAYENAKIPALVIRGNSLRSAYRAGIHNVVGIDGDVIVDVPASGGSKSRFHELHLIHAGVSGDIRFTGGSVNTWGHVFLERAMAGPVACTNDWGGVALYASGWGFGGRGSDADAPHDGIGPLLGRVHPLNMQTILLNGMEITGGDAIWYATWHNVMFRTNGTFNVADVNYGVDLDTASYGAWLAVTDTAGRGDWHTDGSMRLTDGPVTASVNEPTAHVPKFIGDELVVHGGGGLVVYKARGLTTNDWVKVFGPE